MMKSIILDREPKCSRAFSAQSYNAQSYNAQCCAHSRVATGLFSWMVFLLVPASFLCAEEHFFLRGAAAFVMLSGSGLGNWLDT